MLVAKSTRFRSLTFSTLHFLRSLPLNSQITWWTAGMHMLQHLHRLAWIELSTYWLRLQYVLVYVEWHLWHTCDGLKLWGCQIWDIRSKMLVQHYAANAGVVNSVCFHPSGNFLLSTCEDSTIRVSIKSMTMNITLDKSFVMIYLAYTRSWPDWEHYFLHRSGTYVRVKYYIAYKDTKVLLCVRSFHRQASILHLEVQMNTYVLLSIEDSYHLWNCKIFQWMIIVRRRSWESMSVNTSASSQCT